MNSTVDATGWCDSPSELDRALWATQRLNDATVVDTFKNTQYLSQLSGALTGFLQHHFRGGRVLVKTSTAGNRSEDHEFSTTLLAEILHTVVEVVPSAHVILGDGPAHQISYQAECRRLQWQALAEGLSIRILDLNQDTAIDAIPGWPIASAYLTADLVINLSKAKTHRRFGVSLAEKSLLGVLSGNRLGYPKLRDRHNDAVWLLQEIQVHSPPIFSVIDGIRGIQGEGPLRGHPTQSHFVVFGSRCQACDTRACVEMGFDPVLVPLFHRPYGKMRSDPPCDWPGLRCTYVDYVPSVSCMWLYRSLRHKPRRRSVAYGRLSRDAQRCWPRIT